MTKIAFFLLLLRLLHRDHDKKYVFLFSHYVHYFTFALRLIKKKIYFTFQHYVHYALITTEKTLTFIPTLGSLHDKFSVSLRFVVDVIVISPSGNSMKSYMVFFPSGSSMFL